MTTGRLLLSTGYSKVFLSTVFEYVPDVCACTGVVAVSMRHLYFMQGGRDAARENNSPIVVNEPQPDRGAGARPVQKWTLASQLMVFWVHSDCVTHNGYGVGSTDGTRSYDRCRSRSE